MANSPCKRCGSTKWFFKEDEYCSMCEKEAGVSERLPAREPDTMTRGGNETNTEKRHHWVRGECPPGGMKNWAYYSCYDCKAVTTVPTQGALSWTGCPGAKLPEALTNHDWEIVQPVIDTPTGWHRYRCSVCHRCAEMVPGNGLSATGCPGEPDSAWASKHTVVPGATRSEKASAFHLVPREGFRRTAKRFALGAVIHGDWNWLKACTNEGDAAKWAQEAYNHMMEHMLKMPMETDLTDDHLGAIGWAQTVLCFLEEKFGKPWTQLGKDPK